MSIDREEKELEKIRSGLEVDGPLADADLTMRGRTCRKDCKASISTQCSFNPGLRCEAIRYSPQERACSACRLQRIAVNFGHFEQDTTRELGAPICIFRTHST